jgi:hypothetical protein
MLLNFTRFYLNPDDGATGQAADAAPTPDTGPAPTPDVTPAESTPAAPPSGSPGSVAWSLRERAKEKGLASLSQFGSDDEALDHLTEVLRTEAEERRRLAAFQSSVAPHWNDFQKWRTEQAQAKLVKPADEKPKWEAPEYKQDWLGLVQFDPQTGRYVPRPGLAGAIDPSIPEKIHARKMWEKEQHDKFLTNPAEFIKPHIEDYVQGHVKEALAAYRAEIEPKLELESFAQKNSKWLYQHDAAGNVVYAPDGRPVFSEKGDRVRRVEETIRQAAPQLPWDQALNLALIVAGAGQHQQQSVAQQVDPRIKANNGLTPAPATAASAVTKPGASVAAAVRAGIEQNPTNNLASMMLADLKANGFAA